ncbi:MAG: peptide chain release factor N(5)-glutamine methyltransferase [Treponema sp.]
MTIREAKRLARAALTQKDAAFFYADEGIRAAAQAKQSGSTGKEAPQTGEPRFIPSPTPDLDAACILCSILNADKTFLLTHAECELTKAQAKDFANAVVKRRTGLPIAYITGVKEFYGLSFCVSPAVLIPKPDTEILVERAGKIVLQSGRTVKLCDMCTGSGCVGLSVFLTVKERLKPDLRKIESVCLSDISEAALKIAKLNAERLLLSEDTALFSFVQSDLFERLSGKFDVICANPPYIPHDKAAVLLNDGRSEPLLALNGDAHAEETAPQSGDGLAIIRRLVPAAFERLTGGGTLLMECGEYNIKKAAALCREAGFCSVRIHKDLAGQLRLIEAGRT